jgi:hypothetical protein
MTGYGDVLRLEGGGGRGSGDGVEEDASVPCGGEDGAFFLV